MRARHFLLVVLAASSPIWSWGQTPKLQFEVASVRAVTTPVRIHAVSLNINHGRVTLDAAALRQIIGLAYGIQRVRVQGGGSWLDSDLFDIVAKCENPDANRDDAKLMLQALLEDRFQLRTHRETKSLPLYALALAKNGPKLQKAQDAEKPGVAARGGRLEFRKMPIAAFVNTLANLLDNPVLDKTGIQGLYDFTLEWAADDVPSNIGKPLTGGQSGPSLFTAIEEQLGLKLSAEKAPAEVFVIDRATRPSDN